MHQTPTPPYAPPDNRDWRVDATRRRPPASRQSEKSQYEFSRHCFRSNPNLSHPILAVFELPDELILSILSHISPDPQHTRNYECFCIPYKRICNFHGQRAQSLRPLSMTCRAMRLRFLPWLWEYLALSWRSSEETLVSNLNTIANALHADKFVATSVKYFCVFIYP